MSYEVVRLGDVADIVTGNTPSKSNDEFWINGIIPFVTPGELKYNSTNYVESASDNVTELALSTARVIPKNSVMVCCIGSLGKLGIASRDLITNQQINSVVFKEEVAHYKFGYYAISLLRNEMEKIAPSTTVKIINKTLFSNLQIPLPPIDIQKKIADTLDKAQELIDKRKEQISVLDKFLENLFLDMFGDPVSNTKGWDVKELGTLGYFKNGMNYNQSDKGFSIKFLGVGEFKYGNLLKSSEFLPMLELLSEPNEEFLLKNGDIVFVRSNGSKELVGRSILVKNISEKTSYSGFCIRYRNESTLIISDFLINMFANENYKTYLKKDSRGANINNLNQQMLSSLGIIVPPLDLQNQFASIVEKVEAEKTKLEASLKEMEDNFNSIMQRAFKGELF